MQSDIIDELGPLAIGARMRRFYDMLAKDMTKVYKENGLPLEPKDLILYYLLAKRTRLSIAEIANELSLTHPAVIHVAKGLEKMGYVESEKDKGDSRKRYLKLTKTGKAHLVKYNELWEKVRMLNRELFIKKTAFLETISALEKLLEERSFYQRYHAIGLKKTNAGAKKQKEK
jgi:DNA-binding MarR family transcriptional regulator